MSVEYLVLRRSVASDQWEVLGPERGSTRKAAIRRALVASGMEYGTAECVAVPLRSWQPLMVEIAGFRYHGDSVHDLYLAARAAERKLRAEYHANDPEAPEHESWAEGEALTEALRHMDRQLLPQFYDVGLLNGSQR